MLSGSALVETSWIVQLTDSHGSCNFSRICTAGKARPGPLQKQPLSDSRRSCYLLLFFAFPRVVYVMAQARSRGEPNSARQKLSSERILRRSKKKL